MLKIGDVLDRKYRIVRLIGEGGMGAVYEAEHEAIRRRVAIKVLIPELAHDQDTVLRFRREAEAAGRIGHDNICEVIDIGQLPAGTPYIVMPLLKGEPLTETIRREAPLAVDRAADIACQVLDGLGAAHAAGIVHRDLKPDNLFVTRLGDRGIEFVKVLDFGISKILGSASVNDHKQVTKTGMVLGTPSYMAPEQARGMKNLDHRADLYAVGTILFEMLTGTRAFDGETFNEVLIKVVVDPVPAPRALRPEIPPGMEAVILRAMDREPTNRYQSAEEFRRDLLRARDLARGPERRPTVEPTAAALPVPPVAARMPDGTLAGRSSLSTIAARRPRGPLAATLAGVAVVLAAGLGFLLLRGGWHSTEGAGSPDAAVTATAPSAPAQRADDPPRPAAGTPTATPATPAAGPGASGAVRSSSLLPDPHLAERPAGGAPDAGAAPAPATEDVVRLRLEGVPRGARMTVAGNSVPATATTVTAPRATAPIAVVVSAAGFETFRESVVPSEDRVVRVRMRRIGAGAGAARDAGASPGVAGAADAGRPEARTIGGPLGTVVVDDPEGPR